VAAKRLVVIGGSSGAIEAMRAIVHGLPGDFAAPVCVVLHTSPHSPGTLDAILGRAGTLPSAPGVTGARLRDGHIYVAPPDHHLLIEPGAIRLSKGPRENRFRPAIDPLFRSAAQVYGAGVIGVVLTGNLDDGTAGLWTIKQLGGITIVQDPKDALFPSMPASALRHVKADYVVPVPEIAPLLVRILARPAGDVPPEPAPTSLEVEVNIAGGRNAVEAGVEHIGEPSRFACPECHGVLLRVKGSGPSRFRCHTGHAYSARSLAAAVNEGIEDALWTAVRALEEGALLMQHLSTEVPHEAAAGGASDLHQQGIDAHQHSEMVRQVAQLREALKTPKV
jgi:two-component system, chemotaxis family, protein-glutamate methylesterase/glutaminase